MTNSKTPKIIFWGASALGAQALELLLKNNYNLLAVVSVPDAVAGRGQKTLKATPISQLALANKLPLFQPEKLRHNEKFFNQLKKLQPDLGILVAYGKFIPEELIKLFPGGIINLHPSLLPKYRGPSPIQTAILNGDAETGISLMLLDSEMDHGQFLAQEKVKIEENDTAESLTAKLATIGAELLLKTLPLYFENKIKLQTQDHPAATFTKIITKETGQINWAQPVKTILNQIRALTPWPGTWIKLDGKILKIIKAHAAAADEKGLTFKAHDGQLIADLVQLEGKKIMTGAEFLRGHSRLINKD